MEKNTSANVSYKKSSFGPAFFFLSKQRREALAAYYEFCRLMDDIADEPDVKNPAAALDFWQEEVKRIFAKEAQTPLGKQLMQVVKDFGLPQDRFDLLIDGMRYDLAGRTYQTESELDEYIYRVAVIVGLATLDILGVKGQRAQELAQNLGSAVQLTNIIRDVPEDAKLNRVYLPTDLLAKYGLTAAAVLTGKQPAQTAQVLAVLDEKAQSYYAKSRQVMAQLPRISMLPCRMMSCVYAQNLAKIRKSGFCFDKPIKLTKTEKLKGVFYAWFETLFA